MVSRQRLLKLTMVVRYLTYHHVQPVERRVDNEHERIQDDLVTAKFRSKVDHEYPIQAKRYRNKANGQIANLLGSSQKGDDQDEEQ
jgi:predicted metal-dependent peptidase